MQSIFNFIRISYDENNMFADGYELMHQYTKFKPNGTPYYTMKANLTYLVPYTNAHRLVHRSKDWQLLALEYKDQL